MNITEFRDFSFKTSNDLAKEFPQGDKKWLMQRAMYDLWMKIEKDE